MSFSQFARVLGACGLFAAVCSSAVFGQTNLPSQGSEYSLTGLLPGDQTHPQLSFKSGGGYVVWQDNATDGSGYGISGMRLDATLSGSQSAFRVNQIGSGDQEAPQVSILNDGGAVFAWQGGKLGAQRIYARFRSPTNTWLTGDVQVNSYTNGIQSTPALATLGNGNVLVAWASYNQRGNGSLNDVYARLLTPTGQKIGAELPINEFSQFNQRSPVAAPLAAGGFVVVWISEQQRRTISVSSNSVNTFGTNLIEQIPSAPLFTPPSVDVYARLYDANGTPLSSEFLVNTSSNVCAAPSVAAAPNGGFAVAWMEKDTAVLNNGWDIVARSFTISGVGGPQRRVNTQLYGDQYAPQIAAASDELLVVWTSLSQDGSREGVFGQFLKNDGTLVGNEFRVNSTTLGSQMHQAVWSDNVRFLVAWSGFTGLSKGFDLFAQRYADPSQDLVAPAPPTVTTVSSNSLRANWPSVGGLSISNYEVYADGSATATAVVTGNSWTMTGLALNSTHTFQLAYVLTDGRRSPLSEAASGTTHDVSEDLTDVSNNGTLPDPSTNSSGTNVISSLPFPASGGFSSSNATRLTFAQVQGNYNGLLYGTNEISSENSGVIAIKMTAKGKFSAKMQVGILSYSFSGTFNSAGHWGPMLVAGKKTGPLRIELNLDLYGNDQITGQVTSPGKWTSALFAQRAGYGKTHQASFAGTYTFVIPAEANATNSPAGTGIGTMTVDALGNVEWSGTLADGTTASQRTTLSKNDVWPLYAPLYGGKGVLLGWIGFGNVSNYDAYGAVVWTKQAISQANYPDGFATESFLVGAGYSPSSSAKKKADPAAGKVFGNSRLIFSGGSLDASIEQAIDWNGTQVVPQGGGSLSLSLTPATGLFRGDYVDPGTGENLSFQGVLFENVGFGFFLNGNQSGNVYLGPNP